jgi:murein DD-endopeptidase MepM/ murein hydrolase activator NlpD
VPSARALKAPRALKAKGPATPKKIRPARATAAPAKVVPLASARSSPPRRGQVLRKFITISAMFGAGALLVTSSLPAVALQMNSASALTPELPGTSNSELQSLSVDSAAADIAPTRDPYTVVNTIQQGQLKFGLQDFQYTNDTNGTIQWPFPAPVPISSGFGSRNSPCGGCSSFHEGVDFIPGTGTPIGVIADGTVTYAAYDGNFGYHVIVDHNINGQKVQSLYAHMIAGSIKVVVGQQVTVTQELGQVGSTGHSTGAHLHLEVHLDGTPVDPFAWLKANAN